MRTLSGEKPAFASKLLPGASGAVIQYATRRLTTAWAQKTYFCKQVACGRCGRDHSATHVVTCRRCRRVPRDNPYAANHLHDNPSPLIAPPLCRSTESKPNR